MAMGDEVEDQMELPQRTGCIEINALRMLVLERLMRTVGPTVGQNEASQPILHTSIPFTQVLRVAHGTHSASVA